MAVVASSVSPCRTVERQEEKPELRCGGHLVNQRRNSTNNTRVAAQVRRRVARQAEDGHPWHKSSLRT